MPVKDPSFIQALRAITAFLLLLVFIAASLLGVMYGMPSALTFGDFVIISPLEFILIVLSTKTLLAALLIPALVFIIVIVLFGRFFCGWICPVGLVLEFTHRWTEKRRRPLGIMFRSLEKYVVLLAILTSSFLFNFTAPYLFSPPGSVYRLAILLVFRGILWVDLGLIVLFLLVDFFATRFGHSWCRSLCPLGAMMSSLSIVNLARPRVVKDLCIDFDFNCLNCERVCPMWIPVTRADKLAMMDCTKCLKCWAYCPVEAIRIEFSLKY